MRKLYNSLCEHLILPLADLATGRSIAKQFKFLEKSQWWSREELTRYQNQQLRKVIHYAYANTRFFKTVMDERGINRESIKTTSDLVNLPVINKEEIRKHGIDSFVAGRKERLIKEMTSGSSGEQGISYLSKQSQSLTYAAELLFFKWGGFSLGDRHILTGMTLKRGIEKTVKDFLLRCTYVSAFNLSDRDLERICRTMKKRNIRILVGYASSLYCLASYVAEQNESIKLDAIISLGDMLYAHYRDVIESAFQCAVNDTYGCTEGFQIAAQCEHMKYHNCMPLNYIEILDEQDRQVPPGETGRVILTRLDMNPMPMIRCDIGDLAVLSNEKECICGRKWLLLDRIQGRDTDIVVSPNGHKLIVHFFTAIFEHEPRVRQFQVLQDRRDELVIKIVPGDSFSAKVLEEIERQILTRCKNDLKLAFRIVNAIPPSPSGKRKFVISKVKEAEVQRSLSGPRQQFTTCDEGTERSGWE